MSHSNLLLTPYQSTFRLTLLGKTGDSGLDSNAYNCDYVNLFKKIRQEGRGEKLEKGQFPATYPSEYFSEKSQIAII